MFRVQTGIIHMPHKIASFIK